MAKTKTPFLSLGAHGSVGGSITAQKRNDATLLRSMPLPIDRRTLPQVYQRWLYEDYAYWWTLQTDATKQEYATAGGRYHLTGFQYWMKTHLTALTDIVGLWHLDELTGALATDFSRNGNHGTIIGATPAVGAIAGAYYFDGVNDMIDCGSDPSTEVQDTLTLEALVYITEAPIAWGRIIAKDYHTYALGFRPNRLPFARINGLGGGAGQYNFNSNIALNTWTHIALTYDIDGGANNFKMYLDGVEDRAVTETGQILTTGALIIGATDIPNEWGRMTIDMAAVHSRVLTPADLLRHAQRRYP